MNLFNELNHVIHDLTLNKHQTNRENIAHFCEHDGICISFTRARSTWHALAPCALKPWWLFLEPLRKKQKQQDNNTNKITNTDIDIEVTENA